MSTSQTQYLTSTFRGYQIQKTTDSALEIIAQDRPLVRAISLLIALFCLYRIGTTLAWFGFNISMLLQNIFLGIILYFSSVSIFQKDHLKIQPAELSLTLYWIKKKTITLPLTEKSSWNVQTANHLSSYWVQRGQSVSSSSSFWLSLDNTRLLPFSDKKTAETCLASIKNFLSEN